MSTLHNTTDMIADRFNIDTETVTAVVATLDAYGRILARVRDLEQQLGELEQLPRCNGRAFWQDGRPHAGGRLYANHSTDSTCPLHGAHLDPSKPLRKYIGSKAVNVAEALQAMATEAEAQRTREALHEARVAATEMRARLVSIL